MKRDSVVMYCPDYRDVLHRDQQPADENETFDPWIPRFAVGYVHFLDECGMLELGGRASGKQLDERGDHVGAGNIIGAG
jgi:hypothetical protein